jgi:hypothetical protein
LEGSWYPTTPFNELSSYIFNHTHQMSEIFVFVSRKSLDQNICNHIFLVAIHQPNKTFFNVFSHQMMMNFDMLCASMKDIQLWLLSYMTMGFICGTPMFPKSDESHIACLVAYEATIYLAFVDNIRSNTSIRSYMCPLRPLLYF